MLKYVHHIHYMVRDRDAMVKYLEENFRMKPDELIDDTVNARKEAMYQIDKTTMQISEPTDPTSTQGQYLAKHGPGVYHVAWAVGTNFQAVVSELVAKGNKFKGLDKEQVGHVNADSILTSPRTAGYKNVNLDPNCSHGIWFQLVAAD